MDTTRFDSLAKVLAAGGTRRRLVKSLTILGIGGVVARPAIHAAAQDDNSGCYAVKCEAGYNKECYYKKGKCLGCKCIKDNSGGIVGGGLVRTDGGAEGHLSLIATRTPDPTDTEAFSVVGQVKWTDLAWEGAELHLESGQITGYGPTDGVDGGRDVHGWMQASAVDVMVPFFLQVVDAGGPGSGLDTVSLLVGDSVPTEAVLGATAETIGFSYTAKGALVNGDLALVNFGSGGEEGLSTPAT